MRTISLCAILVDIVFLPLVSGSDGRTDGWTDGNAFGARLNNSKTVRDRPYASMGELMGELSNRSNTDSLVHNRCTFIWTAVPRSRNNNIWHFSSKWSKHFLFRKQKSVFSQSPLRLSNNRDTKVNGESPSWFENYWAYFQDNFEVVSSCSRMLTLS